MPRIDVPPNEEPIRYLRTLAPPLTTAAVKLSHAAYHESLLSLRETEAIRATIAAINDCTACRMFRAARDVIGKSDDPGEIPEEFYNNAFTYPEWPGFSPRERLAMDFTRRFATDHLSFDDDLWHEFHAHFTDEELVDLACCASAHLINGRLNRVFEVDHACVIQVPAVPALFE